MFKGLRTVIYFVDDIEKGKEFYSKILGTQPYFDQPFYVGYNVGGYELGLQPDEETAQKGDNVIAYWGVDNCENSYRKLLELGCSDHSGPQDVGEGIVVASVFDTFGNILGIIENPHFNLEA